MLAAFGGRQTRKMAANPMSRKAGRALRTRAGATFRTLTRDLAGAAAGQGVHGSRRRLKVLRSLLRLTRPSLEDDAFRALDAALRQASKRLQAARRHEALGEGLAKLAKGGDVSPPALEVLAQLVAAQHGAAATPSSLETAAAQCLDDIAEVETAIDRWPTGAAAAALYAETLARTYDRARSRLTRAFATDETAQLHEARKMVIHLLHQMEALRALWPRIIDAWTAELDKLRRSLGDLNDLHEIEVLAAADPAAFGDEAQRQEAVAALQARQKRLLSGARKTARRLFAEKPRTFQRRIEAMWKAAAE
jgi:CHAD domain-containing protein